MLKVGDFVRVIDPRLDQLRAIMIQYGHDPGPNDRGTVAEIWEDGTILVEFPVGADAEGQGHSQVAPYPHNQVRKLGALPERVDP